MAKRRSKDTVTERMFPDPTGQSHMFEKSLQEKIEAQSRQAVECLGQTFPNEEARRKHFLDKLREYLRDPEFRKIEGFPIGRDEDILALSDPPYYTACPNPFAADFVKHFAKGYEPNSRYNCEPFAADVSEGKTGALYNAHSYHTKVPPKAIENYVLHFTKPGDVILDGFSGTGMTGVAVQSKNHDRACLLFDLSPAATFISALYNSPVDPDDFKRYAEDTLRNIEAETRPLYETRQPNTNRGGVIDSVIWSVVLVCPSCSQAIPFWDLKERNEELECPRCKSVSTRMQYEYAVDSFMDPVHKQPRTRNRKVPVQITFKIGKKRYTKEPDDKDMELLTDMAGIVEGRWFPTELVLGKGAEWGDTYRAGYHRGYEYVHDFYSPRAIAVLSRLRDAALNAPQHLRIHLLGLLTSVAFAATHLYKYRTSGGGQPAGNNLYIPALIKEQNVIAALRRKLKDLVAAEKEKTQWRRSVLISTASATSLYGIPDASVDYVFVDPPFGANIMYSESSFLWEAWLQVRTNQKSEAIVNTTQRKGLPEYQHLMTACFREFLRVLKPGRWMTVEFHNSQNAVWTSIQEALGHAGFVVADVRTLDKQQGTFKQVTTSGAVKQDLIISAYRPNGGLEERFRLEAGTEQGVWDFVRTHLQQLPRFGKDGEVEVIGERLDYLLFDRMVAFHVQRGVSVPLSAAEFYAGLVERYPQRDDMFFLPEQVAEYDKKRMTVKEVLQLQLFVIDEASAIQWLRQQLVETPRTFQALHPQFMKEIAGWEKHERSLELLDLLRQNFLCYDGDGPVPNQIHAYLSSNFKELRNLPKTDPMLREKAKDRWYVPDPNKAGDLEKLRERALLTEFEDYKVPRQRSLKIFRTEAVRAGFKSAFAQQDYKTIVEVAQKLPEHVLQEDEKLLMYYDVATMRLGDEDRGKRFQ